MDTLVGLEFAGLTGVSSVSLKGGSLEALGVPMRTRSMKAGPFPA